MEEVGGSNPPRSTKLLLCYNPGMEELIAVEQLIIQAKAKGVNFGKGDPYNRLRYYTKMGWLPNMKRKKGERGAAKGHYPAWALDRLILIEKLKDDGLQNSEIAKKLATQSGLVGLRALFASPEVRTRLVLYTSFVLLLAILGAETGLLPFGKSRGQVIIQSAQGPANQIIATGSAFVPAGARRLFVKSSRVHSNSRINVSFNNDYSPAARFWVGEKITLEGFYVELDAPVAVDAEFSWWVSD